MKRRIDLIITAALLLVIANAGSAEEAKAGNDRPLEGKLATFLGEPKFHQQPLFADERFPNITVTLDGTVLATWGNSHIRARRSEDGGETWGEEITIANPGFHGGGTTVDETTGDVLAFVEAHHPPAPLTIYRSKDHGKTWQVQDGTVIKPDSRGNMPSMHMNEHGITLRHGTRKGRLLRPSRFYAGANKREEWPNHYTNAIYSDDGGVTWQTSEPFPENGTGEATLAELSDGRIYYNSRVHWQERPKNTRRRHAWSDDGGETWKDWAVVEVLPDGHQHRSYGCMGGLVRLPIADKDVLIFSNLDTPNPERERATVWASFDGGKTWPVKRLIDKGSSAYSSLTAGRPGTPSEGWIYLHYEAGEGSRVARFNLTWLSEGEATGDGQLPDWLQRSPTAQLEPLPYNHPGLVVDLGVGLWAWPLPLDFDGDGDLDLVVNCPDKPSNGVYFFENASGDTANNSMPVFKPGRRISNGSQNVQISYVDGTPHVLTPGKIYPDFLQSGLEKPQALPLSAQVHSGKTRANMWRMVDYDGDGAQDIIVGVGSWDDYGWDNAYDADGNWTNGPLRGFVYLARNLGTTENPEYADPVKVMAGDQPVEVFGWPSPNFADFDGDADLDLVCGEFLDGFTYFENRGTRTEPDYGPGRRLQTAAGQSLVMDLQMITPTAIDWDKDGDVDLIVGDEDGRVALVEHTGQLSDQGVPLFQEPRYFQQEADTLKFGALATPYGFDWDGDGDQDLISGNTAGYIGFFENLSGPGVEQPKWAAPRLLKADGKTIRIQAGPNGSIQGPAEAKWGYTTQTVADWDGDGLPDLLVNSIWGKVVWYRNLGPRENPKLAAAKPIQVEWGGPQPRLSYGWLRPEGKQLLTQWRTTPVAIDWNRDGLTDLVMLDHEGYLALFERARRGSKLTLLPPQRVFADESGEPLQLNSGKAGKSGRRKLALVDWDGDGAIDIVENSENATLRRQIREQNGKWLFKDMGLLSPRKISGHTTSPTIVDFDDDSVPDLLVGAEDGRFYYMKNH